ncbi:MAG: nitroreductase/quinone reductase family protein [Actinomycetota bacterium]
MGPVEEPNYASGWRRISQRLASTRAGAWFFSRVLHHLDRFVLRITHGRRTLSSMLTGLPVVTLTTRRLTGQVRATPLLGLPYGDELVVIASNWGRPQLPGWYQDLRRDAAAEVSVAGRSHRVRAREVTGDERAALWERACEMYAGYAAYERRIGSRRRIPVMILAPIS